MKHVLSATVLALTVSLVLPWAAARAEGKGETMDVVKDIHWLGHDTFKVVGEKIIYTDPFKLEGEVEKADLVLITHEHYDHCSPDDVAKIRKADTVIVAPPDCGAKLKGTLKAVKPGDKLNVMGVEIEAVPSYNTNKKFHTKDRNWVGYVFTVKGKRIYIAGDTDRIPEMKDIKCDIALLPVSGTYVMTADEAVQAALDIKPTVAIPMHYASIVGTKKDAERFRDELKGKVEVVILGEE